MKGLHLGRPLFIGNNYNNSLNACNGFNNNGHFLGIAQIMSRCLIMLYYNLYNELCSYENLELAFKKARKHKTLKPYIIEFEKELKKNLSLLRIELLLHSYKPKPLETFIIRDPKTRKISKSDFRDRIVHHALCNIIEPIFNKAFIYDSCANRKGKGNLLALKRFEQFVRKVSENGKLKGIFSNNQIKGYLVN